MVGFALVALLLGEDTGPEGMPDRCSGPLHKGLAHELRTLKAPGHPGLLAAPFGHRRDPGIFLEVGGGGRAVAVFAEGDEQPGGEDRARSWEGLEQGEIGMALRTRRDGGVEIGESLPGDSERGDEGLNQEGIGRDDACIGGEGCGGFDALDTRGDDSGRAHVVRTEEGCEGGTAGEWHRREGRPATQEVAEDRGVFLLKPLQHMRARVLECTGQAVGAPPCVADHAATGFDELCEGAHRGALRVERLQRVAMGEQQCELEGGVRGVVCGPAGREGFAIPRQGQGIEREEDQKVIRAPGGDQGALGAFETDGHGLAVAPRAQRGDPRVDGLRGVLELEACTFCGARRLEAHILLSSSPVNTNKGSTYFVCSMGQAASPRVC